MGHRVAVFGASGFAGGELVRLVDGHPGLETTVLTGASSAGKPLREVHPQLSGGDRTVVTHDAGLAADIDLAFLALPHGASAEMGMSLLSKGVRVVDLGSDFRLDGTERYAEAYGAEHPYPDQLGAWAYGIPELFGDALHGAEKVAVPGCYPTSAILALAPLLDAGLIEPGPLVVDSMSGVSGAGRGAKPHLMFGSVDEGVRAYGVLTHRHRPEMEQGLEMASGRSATVAFTPHLVPMQRGILSTCHAPVTAGVFADDLREALETAYAGSQFVQVIDDPPQTRWVVGSNRCLLSVHFDPRTRSALIFSALDNLLKGAAGQAVQCANLALEISEGEGLPVDGWMP
jgi:N-acetyl-gamma-glutamyl-phosphate reductase